MLPGLLPSWIGQVMSANAATTNETSGLGTLLQVVGSLVAFAIFIWNICLKQGKTGQSIGKGILGIKLIGEQTGQPIGGLMCFVRQLLHILDALPCMIGYLWPLWDDKRQTFADKILKTVVIQAPK